MMKVEMVDDREKFKSKMFRELFDRSAKKVAEKRQEIGKTIIPKKETPDTNQEKPQEEPLV